MDIILGLSWQDASFYIVIAVMAFITLAIVEMQKR